MTFNHVDIDLPKLKRETIDGTRYYMVDGRPMVSITSVTSWFNRKIFVNWRKKVGEDEANRITKRSTRRGTDTHILIENYMLNKELPEQDPLPTMLFNVAKKELDKIDNIYAIEESLFSKQLGIAGTVDCIAEYDGELAIIDFKTAEKPKPREWIDHYFVQAVAYACMFYEITEIPVKKLVIIMTCENGDVKVYEERDKSKYIKILTRYIKDFVQHKLNHYGETRTQ
jgi:genome maintenance exonuclease 1